MCPGNATAWNFPYPTNLELFPYLEAYTVGFVLRTVVTKHTSIPTRPELSDNQFVMNFSKSFLLCTSFPLEQRSMCQCFKQVCFFKAD